jgi:hypothetical protein
VLSRTNAWSSAIKTFILFNGVSPGSVNYIKLPPTINFQSAHPTERLKVGVK